jgi:transcriptional regulator with XRE-family HTH domain
VAKSSSGDLERQRQLLSTIVKTIRSQRRLSAHDVAAGMGMKARSYYGFEAGEGPLSIARIWRFAATTDSDPVGIMDGLMLGSPEYALRAMDNKVSSILLGSYRRFNARVGDRLTTIGQPILIEAFQRQFDALEDHLERRDNSAERWLAENQPRVLPQED